MDSLLNKGVIGDSLWQIGTTVLGVILIAILLEVVIYLILGKAAKSKHAIPIMLLTPAIIGISMLVVWPVIYEVTIAFSNMSAQVTETRDYFRNPEYGPQILLQHVANIFTAPIMRTEFFFPIFFRTILWTGIQVFAHVVGGLILAMLLNREIKGRGLYRTLLVIPWAVPQVIAVLAWKGEFNVEYGSFNTILRGLEMAPINWYSDGLWNIFAMHMVNIWLGVPFMMVTLLGGLQAIPKDYYEAAEIDGANAWSRFKAITLPMLQSVMTPVVILGIIWTFNNFNIPFLVNQNKLETSDILVTALYRSAFESPNQYGFAAAFAFIIFFILLAISIVQVKITGTLDDLGLAKKKKKKGAIEAAPVEEAV